MYPEDERLNSMMGLGEPMERFIHQFVDSFVKWEIVQFFHDHPDTPYKAEELARALNRPVEPVRRACDELEAGGFVLKHKSAKQSHFNYPKAGAAAERQELLDLTGRFQALCRTREGRLRVIYKILKQGKSLAD